MNAMQIKLLLDLFGITGWYKKYEEEHKYDDIELLLREMASNGLVEIGQTIRSARITRKGMAHVYQLKNLPFPTERQEFIDYAGNPIQFKKT